MTQNLNDIMLVTINLNNKAAIFFNFVGVPQMFLLRLAWLRGSVRAADFDHVAAGRTNIHSQGS